ncbi:MAG TPA: UvrB/UvrC motif-containing protein [Lacipirellulaceae bacterium]
MGQVGARRVAGAAFRGFGRSRYLPFGAELHGLHVADDLSEVRRAVRNECPALPGVYGVLDPRGELAYIGMSTALRKRLITYFQVGSAIRKEQAIAAHARTIVWEVAGHELTAQLRELELIRRHQPRFNVKGRQPIRPLGFIYLSREDAPRLRIARRVPRGVRYSWGPMSMNWRVRDAVEIVNRLFKLRDCSPVVSMHFADQRQLFSLDLRVQCLRGETGSCLGPCASLCTFTQYAAQLTAARSLLDGRDFSPLRRLEAELHNATAGQQFERAARLRDTLERLQYLCDQLAILRAPPLPEQFVYRLQLAGHQVWYLIRECRVVAAALLPTTSDDAHRCARLFTRMLEQNSAIPTDTDRPAAQIVSSWFRTRPAELQTVISVADVLEFCRSAALRRA